MPLSIVSRVASSRAALTFFICLLLWLSATRATLASLSSEWLDANSNYGHGFLVVALCVFAVWRLRRRMGQIETRPQWIAWPFIAAVSGAWAVGALVHIELVQYLALAMMLPVLVWACFGVQMLRLVSFPLGFIWVAIPVWDPLMPFFQSLTAHASTSILQMVGVPVFREGNALSIPYGQFKIAEFCAGMRYLLAAVSLGAFFAWLHISGRRQRVLFMALVLSVAILANWLRVVIVIIAGHVTHMQSPLVEDHAFMGWVLFALVMLPVFWLGGRFTRAVRASDPGRADQWRHSEAHSGRLGSAMPFGIALAVMVGPGIAFLTQAGASGNAGPLAADVAFAAPAVGEGWRLVTSVPGEWSPKFHGATREAMFSYERAGQRVSVYLVYYRQQHQGEELIFVLNKLYDPQRWQRVRKAVRKVSTTPLEVKEVAIRALRGSGARRLLWSWYDIGGDQTASRRKAKLLELKTLLQGRPGSALVALSVDAEDEIRAAQLLTVFLQSAGPGIRFSLEEMEAR